MDPRELGKRDAFRQVSSLTARTAGLRARRLADICDAFLAPAVMYLPTCVALMTARMLCSFAVAVAFLQMVPEVAAYASGLLGTAMSFCCGLCLGIALCVVLYVVVLWLLSKETPKDTVSYEPVAQESLKGEEGGSFRKSLHPNIMRKGRFASTVWIVSADHWEISRPIHKFPPQENITGDCKGLVKLYAEVKDGVLKFSCVDDMQKRQVLKIDLEGCRCRVVDESLGPKSLWWRKAPLEISHPSRILYQGGTKLLMFCMHGADKEQWFTSLSRYTEMGDSIKVIQHLYKRFSKRCRQKMQARFPGNAAFRLHPATSYKSEKGTWFKAWRRSPGSRIPEAFAEGTRTQESRPTELAEELDQRWNGGRAHPGGSEDFLRAPRSPTVSLHETPEQVAPQSAPGAAMKAELSPSIQPEKTEAPTTDSPQHTSSTEPPNTTGQEPSAEAREGATEETSAQGVYGLNMFMARWAFDLARSPSFEERFRQFILKHLRGLRRPSYITPLTLCELDMGCNFPEIHSVRSLPPQGSLICPELLVDISYAGGLEMTVETSVDLREGTGWGRLDRVLASLHGHPDDGKMRMDNTDLLNDMGDMAEDLSDSGTFMGETEQREMTENVKEKDKQLRGFSMRKFAATKAKQLAERMAETISKIPLRLSVRVEKLEGTMLLWIAPPPSKRLWMSFLQSPKLEITAKPNCPRVVKSTAILGRVSCWLERKIEQSFFNNLVFPNCVDLSFPYLLGLHDQAGLRHPNSTVTNDLTHVSECESEYSEPEVSIRRRSVPFSNPSPDSGPLSDAFCSATSPVALETIYSGTSETSAGAPVTELSQDSRLENIRRGRYDMQGLNAFRKTWEGQSLTDEHQIPTRESHGRRIVKRCMSLSDGDVSFKNSDEEDEEDCVMSDCIEFFDPEWSAASSHSSITAEEEGVARTPVESKPSIRWPTSQTSPSDSVGQDSGGPVRSPTRWPGSRLGEHVRNARLNGDEMETRSRKAVLKAQLSNNLLKAKQKVGERGQKVRGALETRTANLKNAGFSKLWGQRKNP